VRNRPQQACTTRGKVIGQGHQVKDTARGQGHRQRTEAVKKKMTCGPGGRNSVRSISRKWMSGS